MRCEIYYLPGYRQVPLRTKFVRPHKIVGSSSTINAAWPLVMWQHFGCDIQGFSATCKTTNAQNNFLFHTNVLSASIEFVGNPLYGLGRFGSNRYCPIGTFQPFPLNLRHAAILGAGQRYLLIAAFPVCRRSGVIGNWQEFIVRE